MNTPSGPASRDARICATDAHSELPECLNGMRLTHPGAGGEARGIANGRQLELGQHVDCYLLAISRVLTQQGYEIAWLELEVDFGNAPLSQEDLLTRVDLTLTGDVPGLDPGVFEATVLDVDPGCPVWHALARSADIGMRVELAAGSVYQSLSVSPILQRLPPKPRPRLSGTRQFNESQIVSDEPQAPSLP